MKNIPFLNLCSINNQFKEQIHTILEELLTSGLFVIGENFRKFEEKFSEYCGTSECIGVLNGFEAQRLVQAGCGIGRGYDGINLQEFYWMVKT